MVEFGGSAPLIYIRGSIKVIMTGVESKPRTFSRAEVSCHYVRLRRLPCNLKTTSPKSEGVVKVDKVR